LFRFVLAGFLLVMGSITTEILFRLLWTPPPILSALAPGGSYWEPEPNAFEPRGNVTASLQEANPQNLPTSARFTPRRIEIRLNSMGMPGPELGDKQPGEKRVLFGGDSLTFGHRVQWNKSIPYVTERFLRESGIDTTTCNAGVPGYGFSATRRRLNRYRDRVGADAIVAAYFLGNDYTDDIAQRTSTVIAGSVFQGPLGHLMQNSRRARMCVHLKSWLFAESWLIENKPDWSLLPQFTASDEQLTLMSMLPESTVGGLYLDAARNHEFHPGNGAVVKAWLQDLEGMLKQLQQDAGVLPVMLVVLPSQYHLDQELRSTVLAEMKLNANVLQLGRSQRLIRQLCTRINLPYFDATVPLAAAGLPSDLYNSDHVHLSVRGNEVVGKALAAQLTPLL
tara:strand:- start:71888 stop:73069 length:1182 start_codon:yes stop_codon:yes gene_type:complete